MVESSKIFFYTLITFYYFTKISNFFQIIKQLWPNVNQFARNLIKDVIEPKVNEALVAYKMYGFRFERLILGTIVSFFF